MKLNFILLALFILPLASASLCYQDSANKSTSLDGSCSLFTNGTYSFENSTGGEFTNPNNYIDNDTATYGSMGTSCGAISYLYINYTKPLYFNNESYWSIYDGSSNYITTPAQCLATSSPYVHHRIKFKSRAGCISGTPRTDLYGECLNSSGDWVSLYSSTPSIKNEAYLYEEGIYWGLLNDSIKNITINEPSGLLSLLTPVRVNISIYNRTNLDKCWFNVTKSNLAKTLEVPNTYISDCNFTTTSVTELTSYYINVCINYTSGVTSCDTSLFFYNQQSSNIITLLGGGGSVDNKVIRNETILPNLENNLFGWLSTSAFRYNGLNITRFVLISIITIILIIFINYRSRR